MNSITTTTQQQHNNNTTTTQQQSNPIQHPVINAHASPFNRRLCSEAEDTRVAPVRGQASAGTILLLLDAVRPTPQNQNHVSNGVPAASGDHAHQPSDRPGWSRWNWAPPGACGPTARRLVHCVAVVVARTGNVPEATAHGKLVAQFAAPRHANAAHLASNAANAANAGNQVKTFHADPIQNEVINEVTQNKNQKKRKKWSIIFFVKSI